jgi:hypothetical protein
MSSQPLIALRFFSSDAASHLSGRHMAARSLGRRRANFDKNDVVLGCGDRRRSLPLSHLLHEATGADRRLSPPSILLRVPYLSRHTRLIVTPVLAPEKK